MVADQDITLTFCGVPLPRVKLVRDTFAAVCSTCGAVFQDDNPYWGLEKSIWLHSQNHGKKAIIRFGPPEKG
jgi:hypothetical protein